MKILKHHMWNAATYLVVGVVSALALAFGIGVASVIPDYAGAYLNDDVKTYIPVACFKTWREKPSTVREEVRLATVGDARNARYRVEEGCKEYLVGEQRSVGRAW